MARDRREDRTHIEVRLRPQRVALHALEVVAGDVRELAVERLALQLQFVRIRFDFELVARFAGVEVRRENRDERRAELRLLGVRLRVRIAEDVLEREARR